jgi:hypothetical protein
LEYLSAATIYAKSLLGLPARSGGKSLIYDSLRRRKGGSRLKSAKKRIWPVWQTMSAFGGKAENIYPRRVFRLLTLRKGRGLGSAPQSSEQRSEK